MEEINNMSKKPTLAKDLKSLFESFNTELHKLSDENDILELKYDYITKMIHLYKNTLHYVIAQRLEEMDSDLNEHFIIYQVLGVHEDEHHKVDRYQNIGRFIFKYAGALLEDIAKIALGGERIYIPNKISSSPKNFELDCYTSDDNKAHEIKWKDATTDGDHKKKEESKIKGIVEHNYIPVRVMFFMPERDQAAKIQAKVIELYRENGEAYIGEDAFEYVKNYSGIDIKQLLHNFVQEQEDFIKFM